MKKLLIISSVWPEPDSSAAGLRMMQLIKLFQSVGWNITYASTADTSAHAVDLKSLNIETATVQMNSSRFDDFISTLNPQAVMFDRFLVEEQFGWRVAEQCPDALRILDTEDLHCLRRARKKAIEQDHLFSQDDLLQSDSANREIASIYRCDCSLIISEFEIDLLTDVFDVDASMLCYLPFLYEPMQESEFETLPGFEHREGFMTIGNFRHAPNWDSVQYLSKEIWPLIRKQLPRAKMHVYGAYATQRARELHQPKDGFLIKGRAKSSEKVIQKARVCLAPLRFGAGLKGKLVEAMQCGTPSVTTPIGAEGLAGDLPWSGMIESSAEEIADAAVKLHDDKLAWERARRQGMEIINKRFDKHHHAPVFLDRLEVLESSLENHRRQNFTGQMLMHHTAASTKYMSKWIEEKNK